MFPPVVDSRRVHDAARGHRRTRPLARSVDVVVVVVVVDCIILHPRRIRYIPRGEVRRIYRQAAFAGGGRIALPQGASRVLRFLERVRVRGAVLLGIGRIEGQYRRLCRCHTPRGRVDDVRDQRCGRDRIRDVGIQGNQGRECEFGTHRQGRIARAIGGGTRIVVGRWTQGPRELQTRVEGGNRRGGEGICQQARHVAMQRSIDGHEHDTRCIIGRRHDNRSGVARLQISGHIGGQGRVEERRARCERSQFRFVEGGRCHRLPIRIVRELESVSQIRRRDCPGTGIRRVG